MVNASSSNKVCSALEFCATANDELASNLRQIQLKLEYTDQESDVDIFNKYRAQSEPTNVECDICKKLANYLR